MNRLYQWILHGVGRGKRYLLLLALIFASMSSFVVYFSWDAVLNAPATKTIVKSLPDLKLKDGVLVEPENSYHDIAWTVGSAENQIKTYHFIIDTQNDQIDSLKAPANGIYLSRKNAYILSDGTVSGQQLDRLPDFEVKQGELEPILQHANVRFSWALFLTVSIVLFVSLYIWSLVYAALSYFLTMFIPAEQYSFAQRRRLSVAALICSYIFVLPLAFWGIYTSVFMFFVTVLVFMCLFLSGLPKIFIIPLDK